MIIEESDIFKGTEISRGRIDINSISEFAIKSRLAVYKL